MQAAAQPVSTTAHPEHVVTTTTELRDAFDSLSQGDTILITDENAPYRPTGWLDIDVSDVTVVGRGRRPLIKMADGANTGGIRIGWHSHTERVTIDGYSHDGHPGGQTNPDYGYGIGAFDATDITIKNCDIRLTTPWHEHNEANSGIWIHDDVERFSVVNNHFEHIGDRAIEACGRMGYVAGNTSTDGFDRMIAITTRHSDGNQIAVIGNHLDTNAEGSMIGLSATGRDPDQIVIASNTATGRHARLVRVGDLAQRTNVIITHNIGDGRAAYASGIEVDSPGVTVTNNRLRGYPRSGISVNAPRTDIRGNRIWDCGKHGIRLRAATRPLSARGIGENGSFRTVVQNNTLWNNGARAARFAEVSVEAGGVRVLNNNVIGRRRGRAFVDNPRGGATIAWNVLPSGMDLFRRRANGTRTQANLA